MVIDPKERFSDRVGDYVRYRPDYPREALDWIARRAALGPGRVVADVGAGTGIFTRALLGYGARVIAVEPNAAMRAAAEADLAANAGWEGRWACVAGAAEATGLPGASVDLVAVAQAFHWFDPEGARREFVRLLRPGGSVALVWNLRKDTPLMRDYEDLLVRFAPDYGQVRMAERAAEENVRAFFAPDVPERQAFEHAQRFGEAGLRGRLLSASYAPREGHPQHGPMLERLGAIFRAHERGGVVSFDYETVVYGGSLGPR